MLQNTWFRAQILRDLDDDQSRFRVQIPQTPKILGRE